MNDQLSWTFFKRPRRQLLIRWPATRRSKGAKVGGGDRDRTDDLKLAKLPLSQLSYAPMGPARRLRHAGERWWAREDLNFRPHAYQARALTN